MVFSGVERGQISQAWPAVESLISAAVARSSLMSAEFVKERLEKGEWQLWVSADKVITSVTITTLDDYPEGRECCLILCTGKEMANWVGNLSIIEEWAKSKGCVNIKAICRPGWERVLTDYQRTHIVLEKRLAHV